MTSDTPNWVRGITSLYLGLAIAIGLYGVVKISYTTLSGGEQCPSLMHVPACYIITLAYAVMLLAFFARNKSWSQWLFSTGLLIAFGFAAVGSATELTNGDACPTTASGLPLCYVSLALCLSIAAAWFATRT